MPATLIDTARLTLAPFTPEAIDALLRGDQTLLRQLTDASFPMPLRPPPLMETLLPQVRDQVRAQPESAGWWTWLAIRRDTRDVVGALGFGGPPDPDGAVLLGYATYAEADGRGFGTEAVGALIGWALAQPGCRRVCANIPPDNTGARRVAEKVGMRLVGKLWDEDIDEVLVYAAGSGELAGEPPYPVPLPAGSPNPAASVPDTTHSRIYTKTGDKGETGLFGGGRVPKDHPRVSAYGDVDELNSAIGVARAAPPATLHDELLQSIQRDLFSIGGHLATPDPDRVRKALEKAELSASRIAEFEAAMDAADRELPPLRAFVLPAGTQKAAALHLARTICRRAERNLVHLSHQTAVPELFIVYLNRLSDLLFTLARLANRRNGTGDVTW
ncbi:MAG: cob(I)yrinic acid a,c-diamide adenosyltransferase [Gemmatimonadota bacterium]